MASFLNSVRQGFSRPSNKTPTPSRPGTSSSPSPGPTPSSATFPQRNAPLPNSPAPGFTPSANDNNMAGEGGGSSSQTHSMPLFLHDQLQVFLVKGNYMTLAVKPKAVDLGEWIAHQVVEQHRTLTKFIDIVQAAEPGKAPLCNTASCPTMNAGNHTYTWLDSNRQPTRLAAYRYIELVQKWIKGKINDPNLFPTETTNNNTDANAATFASGGLNTPGANVPIGAGPTNLNLPLSTLAGRDPRDSRDWIGKSSGFPDHFFQDCRNMYKQMFRVFAHVYWNHFEWPFYHVDMERWLNSSFMLFVIVGTELELLTLKDLEPMQPLLDKWYALEKFPADCRYLVMVENAAGGGGHGGSGASGSSGGYSQGQQGQGQGQGHGQGYGQSYQTHGHSQGQGQQGQQGGGHNQGHAMQMQGLAQGAATQVSSGGGSGDGPIPSPGNAPLNGGSGIGNGPGNGAGAGTGAGPSTGGGSDYISPAPTPPPPSASGGVATAPPPSNSI